jgi:undecaprenyl-diphosphatase
MGSILCYGMLAWTLTVLWEPARRHRHLLWLGAVLVVALVGVSRVGLGVHFPSDVVGGVLAGGAWLVLWITIAGTLRSHRERIAADSRTGDRGAASRSPRS